MRLFPAFALVACTTPTTSDNTATDTADTASGDTAVTDTADSGDTADTADTSDTGDTADTSDTGAVNYLAGNWSGTLHLDVTEGGFAVLTGSCEGALAVSIPEDETQVPPGTGALTCTTGTTSESTWTLVGEALSGATWSGTATVVVSGWPSGTAHFSGRSERGTLALDVDAGGMTQGDWSYGWAASSVSLFHE